VTTRSGPRWDKAGLGSTSRPTAALGFGERGFPLWPTEGRSWGNFSVAGQRPLTRSQAAFPFSASWDPAGAFQCHHEQREMREFLRSRGLPDHGADNHTNLPIHAASCFQTPNTIDNPNIGVERPGHGQPLPAQDQRAKDQYVQYRPVVTAANQPDALFHVGAVCCWPRTCF